MGQNLHPSFYECIRGARKVLVLDLGFLGDTVHLIPVLWCIREALPGAELHVMVAEHVQSLLQVTKWINRVLGYPRFPKGPRWYEHLGRVRYLRKIGYDAIINVNGSDRSSILTRAVGAKFRLGRMPQNVHWFWWHLFTHTVSVPYQTKPLYEQRWNCLKEAGFPGEKPVFQVSIPSVVSTKLEELLNGERRLIHLSPFASVDTKELPLSLLVSFLRECIRIYPQYKWVISCAPNEREKRKMEVLLGELSPFLRPWRVFPGTLDLVSLAGLIGRSVLHLGGDSGALHLALMMGVPTVSWFREYKGMHEWMPCGEGHHSVVGEASSEGLVGIREEDLLMQVQKVFG